mgnify:CR=1 FL=1
MRDEYLQKTHKAVETAVDIICTLMRQHCHSQIVVAIEDSSKDEVVGFGRFLISTDYHDEQFLHAPIEQRIWIHWNLTRQQVYHQVREHVRNARYLPLQINENGGIINLDNLFQSLRHDKGVIQSHQIVHEKQMECPIEVVQCNA